MAALETRNSKLETLALGANLRDAASAEINVWAPLARELRVLRVGDVNAQPMRRDTGGAWTATIRARAGDQYFLVVDENKPVPDPVSRFLPQGVHGATQIVDPSAYEWHDQGWRGPALERYVIYELHTGTFTSPGTFAGVIDKLEYLRDLGITAIELMPVAAFPGARNWGYDGVSLYAVQASYGGPAALRALVDAAHQCGLAVLLDVVYNHFGNEGNYLRLFGPYFTDRHKTPWGDAINYDQADSEQVRRFIVENALYWIREYHLDGLRLDAVQTIRDDSAQHIVAEIKQNVAQLAGELARTVCVIAETDENDARYLRRPPHGYGLDAVWSDDFHHAVHAFLTGERKGYYQDFGRPEQIARALNQGFVFQGEHFNFWGRRRGTSAEGTALPQHVICLQNHDQVGNRAHGERLAQLAPRGAMLVAATFLLLAPETPLIFMGEEYGEPAPFQFFTSYSDPALQEAVRKGRRQEFKDFDWEDVPDPEDPMTFERSTLNWELALRGDNSMLKWYRDLLSLRNEMISNRAIEHRTCRTQWYGDDGVLTMEVPADNAILFVAGLLRPLPDRDVRRKSFDRHSPSHTEQLLCCEQDGYEVRVNRRGPAQ